LRSFHNDTVEVFLPDGESLEAALARTTHMGIAAHQDDLEIMAFAGIRAHLENEDEWFTGIILGDGRGSPRAGAYAQTTDDEMRSLRHREQNCAALLGRYSAVLQLDYPSSALKDPKQEEATQELSSLLAIARPNVVYTHNLADRHMTHVAVALRTIAALRCLSEDLRPRQFYGCEVWGDLDWLTAKDRVCLTTDGHDAVAEELLAIFQTQLSGGKRYDLATLGRRRAQATFTDSHRVDQVGAVTLAMDLTPLLRDSTISPAQLVSEHIARFTDDVHERIASFLGSER